ncbi:hypothetical protein [Paraconexibacter sp.]|uniref:hypothetical protein n=1 Tax=Paraconexibacter sp. TaxID=2949640 RepID=UPI003565FDB1
MRPARPGPPCGTIDGAPTPIFGQPSPRVMWALIAVAAVALLAVLVGHELGPLTEDVEWHQLWAAQVLAGDSPEFDQGSTPHPLVLALATLAAVPGSDGFADAAMSAVALGGLVGVALACFGLALWASDSVGLALAAGVAVALRPFIVATAAIGYFDLLYAALVLFAVLAAVRGRARAALVLLALAGLVRPDAWILSLVLLALLWRAGRLRGRREVAAAGLLVVAAPIVWTLMDVAVTGELGYSFTHTRDLAVALERQRGPIDALVYGPLRLAQAMNVELAALAMAGLLACVAAGRLRGTDRWLAVGAVAVAGASVVANAFGTSILQRYMIPGAAMLVVLGAVAVYRCIATPGWPRPLGVAVVVLALLAVGVRVAELPEERDASSRARAATAEIETAARVAARTCDALTVPRAAMRARVARAAGMPAAAVRVSKGARGGCSIVG